MYYVTFLRMSHFLWCLCTGGGQGRFFGGLHGSTLWQGTVCGGLCHVQEWQGFFGFSVRHGLVGHGSGLLDLHGSCLSREWPFSSDGPVLCFVPCTLSVTLGVLPLSTFVVVLVDCVGKVVLGFVAALADSAKPSRPTVTRALARSIEGAFFMSPLRVH